MLREVGTGYIWKGTLKTHTLSRESTKALLRVHSEALSHEGDWCPIKVTQTEAANRKELALDRGQLVGSWASPLSSCPDSTAVGGGTRDGGSVWPLQGRRSGLPCGEGCESSKTLKSQNEEHVLKNWSYTVLVIVSDQKVREMG